MTFREIYQKYIKRDGADKFLEWLESTDFFSAPASTKFHDAYEGGLAEHSANTFYELDRILQAYPELDPSKETVAIVSLLHDVCKADCYKVEYRNRKNEYGQWEKYPVYIFKEDFCFGGHGSKSVYLIQKFMPLTEEEATAINCHMGATQGDYSTHDAFRAYPLAFLLHTADMASTINFN